MPGRRRTPRRRLFFSCGGNALPELRSNPVTVARSARRQRKEGAERRSEGAGRVRFAVIEKRHAPAKQTWRSEEHTSELQSLMRISYAVFCLKKKTKI